LLHTAVRAVFAGCVVAIPVLTSHGRLGVAAALAAIVLGEVVVLWLNQWSCPLTAAAVRYTDDRGTAVRRRRDPFRRPGSLVESSQVAQSIDHAHRVCGHARRVRRPGLADLG